MGFCRTNLFKRLESSGAVFLQSVERHVLRNYVFLHAIRHGLPLPLGTQDAEMLDSRFTDEDADGILASLFEREEEDEQDQGAGESGAPRASILTAADCEARAAEIYAEYESRYQQRFKMAPCRSLYRRAGIRPPVRRRISLADPPDAWDLEPGA